ncbi:hypothetical protein E1B28_005834 [Marasmius oreades]|uniref:Uncharacterized protein n=1 Tax=Marasmius oreades TaxID=181124 RepID=A0A9P7UW95_9AGAR|nr:uncharacterized protein E1B28_005834 [Marasmius oreades]KAG7095044.1 hypothetical protein E1B28_005834 [Marasmius oreades]
MIRSNSDTTTSTSSPTPVSPFSSNYSVPSEPTSDEIPDLGQFTAVLRAWNHLQPFPRTLHPSLVNRQEYTTSSSRTGSFPTISSEIESDEQRQPPSTVWAQRPIASYLASGDITTDTETDRERENRPPPTSSSISTRGFHLISTQRAHGLNDEPDTDVEDDEDYSDAHVGRPRMVQIEDLDELDSTFGHDLYYDGNETNNNKELQPVEPGSLDVTQLRLNEESEQSTGLGDMSLQEVDEQPSLGYLDEALRFIAAERERWKAQREAGLTNGSTTLVSEPRRKRRRKRKTLRAHSTTRTSTTSTNPSLTFTSSYLASASTPSLLSTVFQSLTARDDGEDGDADDSSSSYDHRYSTSSPQVASRQPLFRSPATPQRRGVKNSQRQRNPKLKHASSTPQLRPPPQPLVVEEANPRVGQLRALGKKLEKLFPEDKQFLDTVGYGTLSSPAPTGGTSYFEAFSGDDVGTVGVLGNFVDTRGAPARARKTDGEEERIIHVFVDHSNILIGLLNFLKRYPRQHPQYHELLQYSSGGNNTIGNLSSPAYPKPPKHLSHSALTLVLERGRPVTRRVLVTSSPLYQPMDSAELLGFEVRVFARVPDMGDGIDRDRDRQRPGNGHKRSFSSGSFTNSHLNRESSGVGSGSGQDISGSPKKGRKRSGSVNNGIGGSFGPLSSNNRRRGHQRGFSGGTSTESEQGTSPATVGNATFPRACQRSLGRASVASSGNGTPSMMILLSSSMPTSNVSAPPTSTPGQGVARVRYREQGVDELLQLKLHQALASIDGPPPKGSTIILATGDGNAGQFNEDGFLGSVRTALKRGWKVELYAWEGGLSKAWKREFGDSSEWGTRGCAYGDGPRFKVIGMEQFGSELVEIYF